MPNTKLYVVGKSTWMKVKDYRVCPHITLHGIVKTEETGDGKPNEIEISCAACKKKYRFDFIWYY